MLLRALALLSFPSARQTDPWRRRRHGANDFPLPLAFFLCESFRPLFSFRRTLRRTTFFWSYVFAPRALFISRIFRPMLVPPLPMIENAFLFQFLFPDSAFSPPQGLRFPCRVEAYPGLFPLPPSLSMILNPRSGP